MAAKRKLRKKKAPRSKYVHRLEPLEQRILLTTLFGSEVFEFVSADPGNPDGAGPIIRIAVEGEAIVEFIGVDIDDENEVVLADIPGVILSSGLGREGTRIGGGLGGEDGVVVIGNTPIDDPSPNAVPDIIRIDIGTGDAGADADLNHIRGLASRDAAGNGETFGFNVPTVTFGEDEGTVVQLVQLDNATGAATVLAQLQNATLKEDVIGPISGIGFVQFQGFAVDPTLGLGFAVGRGLAPDPNKSHLFRISLADGTTTDLGVLTNTDTTNEMEFVRAVAVDATGQVFVLGDVNGGAIDMSAVAVDKTDATFQNADVTAVMLAGLAVNSRYEAMAFHPDGQVFAVLRGADQDDPDFFDSVLHEINVNSGTALNRGQIQQDGNDTFISGVTFAGLDIAGLPRLVGVQLQPDRLVEIPQQAGDVMILGPDGAIESVFGLGSFTEPGFNADLLFTSDGGDLIRGSATSLPVDQDTGTSTVVDILAADFQPRIGNATDDRLFFVADTDDDFGQLMFHIDVTAPHRSLIQSTITLIPGCFRCELGEPLTIQSMAWDQTSDTSAILAAVDEGGVLLQINPTNTDLNDDGPQISLSDSEVSDVSGIEFPDDNPDEQEEFVIAVDNGGDQLLRVDTFFGTAFVLGPLPDPDDPDANEDLDLDGPIRGEDIQGVAFNPVVFNPFTNLPGALLGTDTTSDELLIIDTRPRIPAGDVFAIYVSQASPGSFISMAAVPDVDSDGGERFMIPFEGSSGSLRVFNADGVFLTLEAPDGTGELYIGARTEDFFEGDGEEFIPIVRAELNQQLGVRPAGLDALPDRDEDLRAGVVIAESLLEYVSTATALGNRLLEFNADLIGELAIPRDGLQIFAVDTDDSATGAALSVPDDGPSSPQIDPSLLKTDDFINSSTGNPVAFELIDRWDQDEPGIPVTLTYSYSNLLDGSLGLLDDQLRAAVEEGLALWATFAPLNFVEVPDAGPLPDAADTPYDVTDMPEIPVLRFGHHTFDGPLGVLAHAFTPDPKEDITLGLSGDIHFDSGEAWSTSFFLEVFVHELAHALGLGHSELITPRVNDPNPDGLGPDGPPIMNPFFQGLYDGLGSSFLFEDDVDGIQLLYGDQPGGVSSALGVGDQLVLIDPVTAKAMTSTTITDAVTGIAVRGVQGLDFGDVDFDGTEELFAVMDVVDFIPSQDIGGDLGGNLNVQDVAVTPGDIMFAVDDDGGTLRLLRIDRDAVGAIEAVVDLGDITDLVGNAVTGISSLASDPSGVLVAIGERAAVGGPMDQELFSISVITVDSGDADLVANEVIASPLATLMDGVGIVTDEIKALDFAPVGEDNIRFAVRDVAGIDSLITIDEDGAVTTVGNIEIGGVSTDLQDMTFADEVEEMLAIDRSAGAGNGRLVTIDLVFPDTGTIAVTSDGSVPDALVGLTSDELDFFFSVSDGEVNPNTVLVSLGAQSTLGTINTADATFAPIGTLANGLIGSALSMAFTPGAGSIAGQQGLFVIGLNSNLLEIDPTTGSIVDRNNDMVGDLTDSIGIITDDSGTATDGDTLSITSFDVDRAGNAFGHDLENGRLVDIDLATGLAGANTATSPGSLRPTVGAMSFDFANDEFLVVDNSTGSLVINNEAGALESAVLMRLRGTESDSPIAQSIGEMLLAGTVTGEVDISGSIQTFYAGWLITGTTIGMESGFYSSFGPLNPDNFIVGGDLRNLVVRDSIGTLVPGDDTPGYLTGFDLEVGGKLGEVKTFADFFGSIDVVNEDAIANQTALDSIQFEIEERFDPGIESIDGIAFQLGDLFELDGVFFNDTFEDAQYVGSIRSGFLGAPDVVRISGEILSASPFSDFADYYALPMMAGETVQIQLFEQFGNVLNIGVFDPDGRLVASDYSNSISVQGEPFEFTSVMPGAHRIAVATFGDADFDGPDGEFGAFETAAPYFVLVDRQGDIGLGGVVAVRDIAGGLAGVPSIRVRRGDLGALVAGLHSTSEAEGGFIQFDAATDFTTDIFVDSGNLRAMDAVSIGGGDSTDPEIEVPNGSVGLIRASGTGSRGDVDHILAVDFDLTPIGGDFQVIDGAADVAGNFEADGGIGVIRAGEMVDGFFFTSFFLNRDGIGADGTIDLIDVRGDFGSAGAGGPAIDTGPGGNVRYIRVGGDVFQDSFFGGGAATTLHDPGVSVELRDDSGGKFVLAPSGIALDGDVIDLGGRLTQPAAPSLAVTTYGIRGSGGVVLVNAEVNGSLQISSDSFGNDQPVEISELVITGDGGGVGSTSEGNAIFVPDALGLTVGVTGSAPVDIFNLVAASSVAGTGVNILPTFGTRTVAAADNLDVVGNLVTGGVFTSFSNSTGGEIVNATIGGAQTFFNSGPIGIGKQNAGTEVAGLQTPALDALPFPFLDQRTGFFTGNTQSLRTNSAAGNIIVRNPTGGTDVRINQLTTNANRVDDDPDLMEGIAGPIFSEGRLGTVQIGEGVMPSGTGNLAKAGIFAEGRIERIVNQGVGSDIRGDIASSDSIGTIILKDGAIIRSDIFVVANKESTREFFEVPFLLEVPDTLDRPDPEIDAIMVNGVGGIIGSSFAAADIGKTTVKNGFGMLNTTYLTLGEGFIDDVTVDGFGIRDTRFNGGASQGDIIARGRGDVLDPRDFTPSVRQSEAFEFDPFFGFKADLPQFDLDGFLDRSFLEAETVNRAGLIDNTRAEGSRDLGLVSAFQIRASSASGFESAFSFLDGTEFRFANSIRGVQTLDDINGLGLDLFGLEEEAGVRVVTGSLGFFKPGADVFSTDVAVAGEIRTIRIKGDLANDSSITVSGPNGNIRRMRVDGDFDGDLIADGIVGNLDVREDFTGNIMVRGHNAKRFALTTFKLSGSFQGTMDVNGHVGTIEARDNLGGADPLETNNIRINGNLRTLKVGTDRAIDGSQLGLELIVLGDLGMVDVTGEVTNDIIVDGTLSKFNLKADATTANTDILTGNVTAFGKILKTTIVGGNIGNNVRFFAGQDMGPVSITGGNVNPGAIVGTTFGDIAGVAIKADRNGMGGNLFGSLTAVNGTIRTVSVLGSDFGDGVNAAQITAQNVTNVRIDSDMAANAIINAVFDLGNLLIGRDILAGASITADAAKSVKVGRDMLGAIALGAAVRSTSIQVDRNLGGSVDVAGNAKITVKGNVTQAARMMIGRNLEQLTVGDTLSGHLLVDGTGGNWRATNVADAVVTTGFGLTNFTVADDVNNLLLQIGITPGGDGQFAGAVADKEFDEVARASQLGKMRVGTITDSVIASAGGVNLFQSDGTMTNTSVSSGLSLGSVAISQVLADATPLADDAERKTARLGVDRDLLHGNFMTAKVGGAGMINSDFTAGVDSGPDGIFGTGDDQVVIPAGVAPLPSGGGFSMFGTVTAFTNGNSDVVADSGIMKNNVTGSGGVVANVAYDVIADLNGPDPMVQTLLGTADEDNPFSVNVGISAQGPIEVTFSVIGDGFIDVFDDTPNDDIVDAIVIRGTDSRSRIMSTSTQPGTIDIRRVLTEDDNQFRSFSFDADLIGDGPNNNTPDVWIDGGLDTFTFVDLGDDLSGQVGGDVKDLTLSTLGNGFLRITGGVDDLTLDDGDGGRLTNTPVPAAVNEISAMSIDNAGNTQIVNPSGGVGSDTPQLLGVDPTVANSIATGPFDIVDIFSGDPVPIFGADFSAGGDLFAVGSVRNLNPIEVLGAIGAPAQVVQLRGLAVNDQDQGFAIDSGGASDALMRIDAETGAGTSVGVLLDIFANTFSGNFLALAFDNAGSLIGLVDDRDGDGGAADTTTGVSLVEIETQADANGSVLVHRIGSDVLPGVFLTEVANVAISDGFAPDPDLEIRGLAVDGAGTIFTVRRDLMAGTDELISFNSTGTVTSRGVIQVNMANTNIRALGFFNGTLVGFDNDGVTAQLVVIDTADPGMSQNFGFPGVLDPALDDFTIGAGGTQSFAYDTNVVSGRWLAGPEGQVATLGTIDTTNGQFTQRLPLARDAAGTPLAAASESTIIESVDVPKAIDDLTTITSTLDVNGISGTITDLNITLTITHPFVSDLDARLTSPMGTQVLLFDGVGGSGQDFINTTFDDESNTSIALGAAPFTDSFQPQGFLGLVDGQDPNGVWTLQIEDMQAIESGTLNNWSIEVTTDVTIAPERVVGIAVDNFDTGNIFVATNDFELFEYDTDGNLQNAGPVGTFTSEADNTTVQVSSVDFNDTTGDFQGVDGQFSRFVEIDKTDADIEASTDPGSVPAEVDAIAFDSTAGIFRGFFDDPNDVTDGFVTILDTVQQLFRGLEAEQISRLTVTGADSGVFNSRIATTGQSIGTADITGDFLGALVTTGSVTNFTLENGDFGGQLLVGTNANSVTIENGNVLSSGVFQIQENLNKFEQTGATFDGQILADTARSISVAGDAGSTANVVVNDNVVDVTFDGSFNGTLRFGSVSGKVTVEGLFDESATLTSDFDVKSLNLDSGTETGSVVNLMGGSSTVSVGGVHRGSIATREGVGRAMLAAVDRGLFNVGQNLGSLTVSGNATGGLFGAGTWIGPDNVYNTADDIIFGGSVGSANFNGDYVDTVLSAGVLPNLGQGGVDNDNANNLPDDNFAFVGSMVASQSLALADSAEAGGILPSEIGRVMIRGNVRSTGSLATGATAAIVAADTVSSIAGGGATNLGNLTERSFAPTGGLATSLLDLFDPVAVESVRQITNSEFQVVFTEPVISASLILSEDNDDDGMFISPNDVVGTVTLDDGFGTIIDDATLQYSVRVDPISGREQGVLQILRAEAFTGRVDLTLAGSAPGGMLVEQEDFELTPVILDRSGLRSVLRDFNQDGVKDTGDNMGDRGEDLPGTIFDGDGNGFEGGDFLATILIDDAPNSFTDAHEEAAVPLVVDDGGVTVTNAFDDEQDIDIYRIIGDAFQFLSAEFVGETDIQMGVFIRDNNREISLALNEDGTLNQEDTDNDTFEMLTRWELSEAGDLDDARSVADPDPFMAVELRPIEDSDEVGGLKTDDIEYFVFVAPSPFSFFNAAGDNAYQFEFVLSSTDTALGALPNNETIAYVSNFLNENNNEQGFITPSQLVHLDFDGGTSRQVRPNQFVDPFDAGELNPQLDGLDNVLIEGSNDLQGEVITGIVENIMDIFQNTPATHPLGVLNVQRFVGTDLQALGGDVSNLPEGLIFTTVDPTQFGLDRDTEFTTILIGQLGSVSGLFGEASIIDYANERKGDEAIVFAQNFSILDPGSVDLAGWLNAFSTAIASTTAHELGHTLGSNHTERNVVADDPNNDGVLDDAFLFGELNLMSGGPSNIFPDDFFLSGVLGTAPITTAEFLQVGEFFTPIESEAYTDSLTDFLFWLS